MSETVRVPPFSALRALEAVARLRGVTAAARELQLSHPAVSQALSRLEGELGEPLFSRSAGGPIPTEIARELIGAYKELVARVGRIYRGQAPAMLERIRLSAPPLLAYFWFSQIDAVVSPALEFNVGADVEDRTAMEAFDIALVRFAGANEGGFGQIAPERLVIAVPSTAGDQGAHLPSLVYTSSLWRPFLTEDILTRCGLARATRNFIDDPGVCLALAEAHGAACLFDERVLRLPRYRRTWRALEGTAVFTGHCYGIRATGDILSSAAARHVLAAWRRWTEQREVEGEGDELRQPAPLRFAAC